MKRCNRMQLIVPMLRQRNSTLRRILLLTQRSNLTRNITLHGIVWLVAILARMSLTKPNISSTSTWDKLQSCCLSQAEIKMINPLLIITKFSIQINKQSQCTQQRVRALGSIFIMVQEGYAKYKQFYFVIDYKQIYNLIEMSLSRFQQQRSSRENKNLIQSYKNSKPLKRKFVQHSIFLPIINKANQITDNSASNHNIQPFIYQNNIPDELETTMQYLNECDVIIDKLKRLNEYSTKKTRRIKTDYDRAQSYNVYNNDEQSRLRELERRKNALHSRAISDSQRNDRLSQLAAMSNRSIMKSPKLQFEDSRIRYMNNNGGREWLQQQLKRKSEAKKNSPQKEGEKKKTEQEIQEERRKNERTQKIYMKFLNKAKTRGAQLHKKIEQFRQKRQNRKDEGYKSLQQKEEKIEKNIGSSTAKKLPELNNSRTQKEDKKK